MNLSILVVHLTRTFLKLLLAVKRNDEAVEVVNKFCNQLSSAIWQAVTMSDHVPLASFSVGFDAEQELFLPSKVVQERAHCSSWEKYIDLYEHSINDPEKFWSSIAEKFWFKKKWSAGNFLQYNFDHRKGPVFVKWMADGVINVCHNVLDRNVQLGLGGKIAYMWEGNEPDVSDRITYSELLNEVCKFANVLKRKGVRKGDRVTIYLPMIPELPIVMLACARIGAVHAVVFGGYSAEALAHRIMCTESKILITADGSYRATKAILLKNIADKALLLCRKQGHLVDHRVTVGHLLKRYPTSEHAGAGHTSDINGEPLTALSDTSYDSEMAQVDSCCQAEDLNCEDPLFILYTSGSTGQPKGIVHTQAGYLLYAYTTFRYVFDIHDDDTYFCTADIGWITGHSYVVYGPLATGCTSVLFEGVPFYPDASRYWQIVDKYDVTKFYTAPTAIRHLMKFGDTFVDRCKLKHLQVLGTVGEPINPDVWLWYYTLVGKKRCSIVDTYWQTETGGHMLSTLPGCSPMKPGSSGFPFFGAVPVILNDSGEEITGAGEGRLGFKFPWPGMARTIYGSHERYVATYFSCPGYYTTGDGCLRDGDGFYWITGRLDDMMNVSGHLLSSAEIESAVSSHPSVAEAAVVAAPHAVKGQIPYCFVTLKQGCIYSSQLVDEIKCKVRAKIGPVAVPEVFQKAESLPKTRSGKIMRRILRGVADGNTDKFGDLTSLAEEHVVQDLMNNRPVLPDKRENQ